MFELWRASRTLCFACSDLAAATVLSANGLRLCMASTVSARYVWPSREALPNVRRSCGDAVGGVGNEGWEMVPPKSYSN